MKDKIRLDLSNDEKSLIIKSLNTMRNYLSSQNRSVDSVDEIILKVNESNKLELDIVDVKIIINSLNNMRCMLKNQNKSLKSVIDILEKLIDKTDINKSNYKRNNVR